MAPNRNSHHPIIIGDWVNIFGANQTMGLVCWEDSFTSIKRRLSHHIMSIIEVSLLCSLPKYNFLLSFKSPAALRIDCFSHDDLDPSIPPFCGIVFRESEN